MVIIMRKNEKNNEKIKIIELQKEMSEYRVKIKRIKDAINNIKSKKKIEPLTLTINFD